MLPILQSSGFAAVQSPSTADGPENSDLAKDLQRSDRFASLVRDSEKDTKAEELVEEIADAEAADESDTDESEGLRQRAADQEREGLEAEIAALDGNEASDSATNQSYEPEILTDVEQNQFSPQTSPTPRSERDVPSAEAIAKSIQTGTATNVTPRQTGQSLDLDLAHSTTSTGTIVSGSGVEPSTQMPVSAAQAAVKSHLVDVLDLSAEPGQKEVDTPRARAANPALQSGLAPPVAVDSKFHAAPGILDEVARSRRMQIETLQTGPKSFMGEKSNPILVTERLGISTQGQAAPGLTSLANLPETRFTPHGARTPANARIKSAGDLADLAFETEAPQTAKKPSASLPPLPPLMANGTVTLGQSIKTTPGNDELLRAGLITTPEHHIQSTSSDAILRSTQVQPHELPRHIARQLAEITQRMPNRPVEVALNPEELGRVRMSISTHDTGITMALLAERQETLDLMRRHIDELSQEFHALGFGDVRFSFSQNNESDGSNADPMHQDSSATADNPSAEAPIQLSLSPSAGLDLRL